MDDLRLRERLIRLAYARPDLRPHVVTALTSAAMPESDFWEVVEGLGWGTRTTDYKTLKKQLVRNLSPNRAAAFHTAFSMLKGQLYKAVQKWEDEGDRWLETGDADNPRKIGLGDDGFGDLLAHIVGLGKREYYAVLRNPQLAKDRAVRGDFEESFAYAIPHTSDYKLLDVAEYQRRGEPVVAVAEWLLARPEARPVQRPLRVLVDGFDVLNRRGAHEFVAMEDDLVGAAKTVEDWWNKWLRELWSRSLDSLAAEMPERLMSPGHLYWGVKNIVTDMKDYLLD